MMNRRGFLRGLFAAPAIVAAHNLMPVRGIIMDWAVPMGISQHRICQLLLPGLWDMRGAYSVLPRQWERAFTQDAAA